MQDRVGVPLRWGGALAIVVALHGAAAWMLLSRTFPPMVMPAAPEAVMLDLAPELPPVQEAAVALPVPAVPPPPVPAAEAPPPPPVPVPEPTPEPPVPVADPAPAELPPTPLVQAEAVLPVPPPPPPRPQVKPKPRPIQRQVARPIERPVEPPIEREAPRVAEAMPRPAPVQAAPAAARPPAPASTVSPSWRSDLLSRLQRAKRYPELARAHGDQGIATVTFTMDRAGRVLAVTLVRSSNSALLDDEAVSLVRRAEPLPSLPPEMPGNSITLTVPISFALR